MHYLIDAHNLIGQMSDISLEDPDDEAKLVLRLRSWAAGSRKRKVTVIFDYGLPGGVERGLSTGPVKVVFAPAGRTADSLLIKRINQVRNPQEFTLVSSDLTIIRAAQARRMPILRSDEFAQRLKQNEKKGPDQPLPDDPENPEISPDDISMWLEMFDKKSGDKK